MDFPRFSRIFRGFALELPLIFPRCSTSYFICSNGAVVLKSTCGTGTIFNENILDIITNISQNKFEKQYIQIISNNDNNIYKLIQDEISSEKMLITLMNDEKSRIIE